MSNNIMQDIHGMYMPNDEVVPGVVYGRPDRLLSPAYWVQRCREGEKIGYDFISLGSTLFEEVGFCLLGGFGVKLEVCEAFYNLLQKEGAFTPDSKFTEEQLFELLNTPIKILERPHRYRFPRQRARRIHLAMKKLEKLNLNMSNDRVFRDQIQSLEGVGYKTASWIARNWLGSERVAILDIHILRAGQKINLFKQNCTLPKDYLHLENRFLDFANAIEVRASILDAVIWTDMRNFGSRLVSTRK